MSLPFACRFKDGAFYPVPYFKDEIARSFEEGTLYRLEEVQTRSWASHGHFFAVLNDAFKTLPEKYSGRFSDPDHLRKYALIKAGFRSENVMVFASADEALRASFLVKDLDRFAITVINENVLTVYRAESQSRAAMGAKRFQESKDGVFQVLAELLGVDPTTLTAQAGTAA